MCTSELDRSNESKSTGTNFFVLGESASPFIDEGDGLTSEERSTFASKPCCPRRRVQDDGRHLLHCWMLDARGRLCCLLRVWQTSASATLLILRGIQGFLPCSHGVVNAGAHNTIDAQRYVGGALPYLSGMGVNVPTTL